MLRKEFGNFEPGFEYAQQAVELAPRYDLAYYALGLYYQQVEDTINAVVTYNIFLQLYWERLYVEMYKVEA